MSQLSQIFKDIADAIRSKSGSTNSITPLEMPQAINEIPSGGGISKPYYIMDRYLEANMYATKDPTTLQIGDELILLTQTTESFSHSVRITDIHPSEESEGATQYDFTSPSWNYSFAWQPSFSENDLDLV